MNKLAALLLFLLSSLAVAEPHHCMKKENPKELGFAVAISPSCGISRESFSELVLAAFLNGQMDTTTVDKDTELYLSVGVTCYSKPLGDHIIWTGWIEFVGQGKVHGDNTKYRYGMGDYVVLSVDQVTDIMGTMFSGIEQALVDYRKVNSISVPMDKRFQN